jgi:hypothetical protein
MGRYFLILTLSTLSPSHIIIVLTTAAALHCTGRVVDWQCSFNSFADRSVLLEIFDKDFGTADDFMGNITIHTCHTKPTVLPWRGANGVNDALLAGV